MPLKANAYTLSDIGWFSFKVSLVNFQIVYGADMGLFVRLINFCASVH